ncbi:hypothetical protein [Rhodovulum sulfidophilum]|uniref:Uncharacterized protein n=1 Tax=Rhodovulum sulfidophilum TaxID=35806 RepID=A0ABS1RZL2_RHOSU|nr:hypothetical protein [Rhodovulum sulfidophilum]MBL3610972.1 hypothetical protein [Rhodovulum sulfidophilum]MCE8456997.1 hypothetical protein [Rhodovulum sulfidophilum]
MQITDRKSAEAWLKDQPHPVQVVFAARCTPRALPAIMLVSNAVLRESALPVLRATLTSAVAGICPTPAAMRSDADAAAEAKAAPPVCRRRRPFRRNLLRRRRCHFEWRGQADGSVTPAALPEGLARQYEKLRSFWKEGAPVWTFWQNWYEDMLAGRPVDWDFLRQVVLLPDEDCKAGPARIASLIRGNSYRLTFEACPPGRA